MTVTLPPRWNETKLDYWRTLKNVELIYPEKTSFI